nr:tail fiber protein [uncultured Allomuricauda sp.]
MRRNIFPFLLFFSITISTCLAQTLDIEYLNPKFISNGNYKYLRFGDSTTHYAGLMWNEGNSYYGDGDDFSIFTYDNRDITIRPGSGNLIVFPQSAGNMGIGTAVPDSKLHIYIPNCTAAYPTGTSKGNVVQSIRSNNNGVEIGNSRGFNDRKAWILARHSSVGSLGKYYSTLHLQPDIGDKSQYRGVGIGYDAALRIPVGTHFAVNGKVGIGTLNPDTELTVKGNIHAEEVKVDLSVPGPDYVFKEGYHLKSLEEVQNYIKVHGHLPNIPSAKEMESNGIQLGEMNMKLLEKIEELTLYTLEQEKKIKEYKKEVTQEKIRNQDYEERISKIEQFLMKK